MNNKYKQAKSRLSGRSLKYWRMAQISVAFIGLGIFGALIFLPEIGLHAFWNVLIPVAPALVIFATGLWRNVCPMASTALLPRHLGLSRKKSISIKWQQRIQLFAVIALLLLIPLRHVLLDTNGPATAFLIFILAIIAFFMGTEYDWKSVWCSGLCPISPVEKLYGRKGVFVLPNAHCHSCVNCVSPCPDSTHPTHPLSRKKHILSYKIGGTLIIGGFPGYIWGWFQVPDYHNNEGWNHLIQIYGLPVLGLAITLTLFIVLQKLLDKKYRMLLINLFAAAAVSCYYWFRIPALIGFGKYPQDGRLIDLTESLPLWFPSLLQLSFVFLFFWWLVIKKEKNVSWVIRPPYTKKNRKKKNFV